MVKNACTQFEWDCRDHGEKTFVIEDENIGLRDIWLTSLEEASDKAGDNTLLVVFEDDIRVSQHYFQGLLAMVDAYGRNRNCRDQNLMGFSLSPIRVEEFRKPFLRWNASNALGKRNSVHRHIAFLSVVPSSWGAAYWSDRWQEFAKFARKRTKQPFYDKNAEKVVHNATFNYDNLVLTPKVLQIPDSRSNVWPKSWKRFLVDFMYARGLVMLYPSLPEEKGFATTLQLDGEHASKAQSNPRVASLIEDFRLPGKFPIYGDLAVFGLHLELTTREELAIQGAQFIHSLQVTLRENCSLECQDLLKTLGSTRNFRERKE